MRSGPHLLEEGVYSGACQHSADNVCAADALCPLDLHRQPGGTAETHMSGLPSCAPSLNGPLRREAAWKARQTSQCHLQTRRHTSKMQHNTCMPQVNCALTGLLWDLPRACDGLLQPTMRKRPIFLACS